MSRECSAILCDDTIQVRMPYYEAAGALTGREWNAYERCWVVPFNDANVRTVATIHGMRLDEAIQDRLEELVAKSEAVSADSLYSDTEPIARMPLVKGIIPFPHQIRAYNLGISKPCIAILHEQGVGKTLTAICIIGHRAIADGVRRVLVMCPVSVMSVWEKELAAMLDYNGFNVTVLEGSCAKKAAVVKALHPSLLQIVVCNYESAWREPLDEALFGWKPEMIIADESQRIKNHTATQSKMMHTLGDAAKYKLILSGTPVMNSPLDFYSQYRFLDWHIFGKSFYPFRAEYAVMGEIPKRGGGTIRTIVGTQNLDRLVSKAHSIASRVTKKQCLKDLPPELPPQYVYCELDKDGKKLYREIKNDMISELSSGEVVTVNGVLAKLTKLSQITGGFINIKEEITETYVDEEGEVLERVKEKPKTLPVGKTNPKLALFRETLSDLLDSGQKVVVFARYTAEIEVICKAAQELSQKKDSKEVGYRLIHGGTKKKVRGKYVEDFEKNKDVKVFVAQIQAAGLGITLVKSNTAIFYSCDYSYGNHEQAKARIHRIGQVNPCSYIYLMARDTLDDEIMAALDSKKDVARLVVDEWRTLLA